MTDVIRFLWVSPNGKYKVLVRRFTGDNQILVDYWKLVNGKQKDIRYKDLPKYVKKQIVVLKDQVIN
jgi:hypothetical protein